MGSPLFGALNPMTWWNAATNAAPTTNVPWALRQQTLANRPTPQIGRAGIEPPSPQELFALEGLRFHAQPPPAPEGGGLGIEPEPEPSLGMLSYGIPVQPGQFAMTGAEWAKQQAGRQAAGQQPWQQLGNMDFEQAKRRRMEPAVMAQEFADQRLRQNETALESGAIANQRGRQQIQLADPAFQREQFGPDAQARVDALKGAYGTERGLIYDKFIDNLNMQLNPRYQNLQDREAFRQALSYAMRAMGAYGGYGEMAPLLGLLGMDGGGMAQQQPQGAPQGGQVVTQAEVLALAQERNRTPDEIVKTLRDIGYVVQ